ncbi:Methyltransferase domain-containing protein [Humidesulfovibrio mexicanus]|uniref:Methyltransferase domain-containing protein n=1 Tax=Humidesulfovibrio mexicanus TaxID=147047 RepID=A0A238Y7P0_9BACT|nr:methyltransferase domain-containing protein [Humidesulfovibrio mexicanus]SNR67030.1 Methyltransferase domain-containing protein [Humidesulfovibrio mexicanus]
MSTQTHCRNNSKTPGRGPTSFWLQDPEHLFAELDLRPGQTVLDLGCGAGEYALRAALLVGPAGRVLAADLHRPYAEDVAARALEQGLANVEPLACDMARDALPVPDGCVDLCLVSTVLHGLTLGRSALAFAEVRRVLAPGGRLAVLEMQKREMPFGPPVERRIAPEELRAHAESLDFSCVGVRDFEYSYLMVLRPAVTPLHRQDADHEE